MLKIILAVALIGFVQTVPAAEEAPPRPTLDPVLKQSFNEGMQALQKSNFKKAEELLAVAVQRAANILPDNNVDRLLTEVEHAGVLNVLGQHARAISILQNALERVPDRDSLRHPLARKALLYLASAQQATGQLADAAGNEEKLLDRKSGV